MTQIRPLPLVALTRNGRALIDFDLSKGTLPPGASFSRASGATNVTFYFPGDGRVDYANDEPRLTARGLLLTSSYTNYTLASMTPANHTTASMPTGSNRTFWAIGSGSAAIAAGTAVGTGWGSASNASFAQVTVTGAGNAGVTVTGSLDTVQWQALDFPGPAIITAAGAATSAVELCGVPVNHSGPFTIAAEFIPLSGPTPRARSVLTLGSSTTNFIGFRTRPSESGFCAQWGSDTGDTGFTGPTVSPTLAGQRMRAGMIHDGTTGVVMATGADAVRGVFQIPPNLTTLVLGERDIIGGGVNLWGWLCKVWMWRRSIGEAALRDLVEAVGT